MNSSLRGKQHKSPLVGSGLYCESTPGASVPTAACFTWVTVFKSLSRAFSHLTILTLKISTRECRQIAEQSPHRALSFRISLLCCFLLWELLGDGGGWGGGQDPESPACGQNQKLNKMSFSSIPFQVDRFKIWFAVEIIEELTQALFSLNQR